MSLLRHRSAAKPPPAPVRSEGAEVAAEVEIFIQQARWLLEWHNKRTSAFEARATALLGFVGVMFVLLPVGVAKSGSDLSLTTGMRVSVAFAGAFLIITAVCCAITLAPGTTAAPAIDQLREQWRCYAKGPERRSPAADVAESFLHGVNPGVPSPIQAARVEADRRGRWFTRALWSLGSALAALATLMTFVLLKH